MQNSKAYLKTRQQTYRASREAMGEAQMQVWLSEMLHSKMDELVKAGQFKNRSELVSAAINRFIEEHHAS